MPVSPDLNFNTEDGEYMLKYLSFDSQAFKNTPVENLPPGWNPDKIIENGMAHGQNIDKMHSMGYTGKNITVAVIDTPILLHDDIRSSLVGYECMDNVKKNSPA